MAGVNGVIPWACIQTDTWVGGDPNPGTAIRVDGEGGYAVEPGYYYFKQVSRAGQPGMAVAKVISEHPDVRLIAFSSNGTKNPDAFAVFHTGGYRRDLVIEVEGAGSNSFEAYVTGRGKRYAPDGLYKLRNGAIEITLYPDSVVTFFAKN
jgi:hypothetical protein